MALDTYSELQTALGNWLARSDLSALYADFISLAEARINRNLPLRVYKADTALAGTVASRQIALPSDFLEAYRLQLTTGGSFTELKPATAATMAYSETSGTPAEWAINGAYIDLDRPCDQAHTFSFRYRQKLALSDDTPTNWLLTNHPDVYLWGALVEASAYTMDAEFATAANQRFAAAAEELSTIDSRSDARATLSVDPALMGAGSATYSDLVNCG